MSEALIETWTLYSVGSLAIALRVFSRFRIAGFQNAKIDDYLVIVAWMSYTVMTVAAQIVGGTGDTSNIPLADRLAMTDAELASRATGSKWFMVGWYSYIGLIWTMKFNMLCFYQRVVNGLWVEKFIKPAMALVIVTGTAIILTLSLSCRPFHKLWQVLPDPGTHCTPESPVFLITILTFNLVTDLSIMIIPAPVILPIKTSIARKIGLYLLFGAGTFVMVAAILRVIFVLALQSGATAAIWSCREDLVAIVVGQAAMIRPIFTRGFWGDMSGNGTAKYGSKHAMELSSNPGRARTGNFGEKGRDPYSVTAIDRSDSTENIMETPSLEDNKDPMVINVHRRVDVDNETISKEASDARALQYKTYYGGSRSPV
ncbi:hypothetical protein B7494_g2644 [Chlorociboria aeruginascens]|nr:hypothetical protein B7494_g2644 [Chlorociboria aeruginascens]